MHYKQRHIPKSVTTPEELELYTVMMAHSPHDFVAICSALHKGRLTGVKKGRKPIRTLKELEAAPIEELAIYEGIGEARLNTIRKIKGLDPIESKPIHRELYLVTVDGHSSSSGCDIYVAGIFRTYERAEEVSNKLEKRFPTSITQVELGKEYDMEPDDIGCNYFNELYLGGHTGL